MTTRLAWLSSALLAFTLLPLAVSRGYWAECTPLAWVMGRGLSVFALLAWDDAVEAESL